MEAMRALKRRLTDIVYRHMLDDAVRPVPAGTTAAQVTGPAGHPGAATSSSAVDANPGIDPRAIGGRVAHPARLAAESRVPHALRRQIRTSDLVSLSESTDCLLRTVQGRRLLLQELTTRNSCLVFMGVWA
jgi:hypothetical protein